MKNKEYEGKVKKRQNRKEEKKKDKSLLERRQFIDVEPGAFERYHQSILFLLAK